MRFATYALVFAGFVTFGCAKEDTSATPTAAPVTVTTPKPGPTVPPASPNNQPPTPASEAADGTLALTPANTKITFVGLHTGEKKDPRTGGFEKFSGQAKIDKSAKTLASVSLEIESASVTTEIPMLTTHLKSADFLDVREHPKLTFESTNIEVTDADAGQVTLTGQLTMHGVTKEITIPATVKVSDEGVSLTSNFAVDRTEFGMNFGVDKVEKDVALTVTIDSKTGA